MAELDPADEDGIQQQLETIEEQREALQEERDNGSISEAEFKREDSKLRFQAAQIKEANAKDQGREASRESDWFGD
jgi:hypothetical protein